MTVEKKFLPEIHICSSIDLSKRWYIHYRDEQNKRVRKYGKIDAGQTFDERMSIAQLLKKEYFQKYKEKKHTILEVKKSLEENRGRWRLKTYQTNKSKVDCFEAWLNGREVTQEVTQLFFQHLSISRSKTTYNSYLSTLRYLFAEVDEDWVFKGILRMKAQPTPARYFQTSHIQKLRKEIIKKSPELWFFCQLMANCFLRPGEIRAMKVGDFIIEDEKIRVRGEVSKNKKTQYIPILPSFLETLRQQLENRKPREFLFTAKYDKSKMIGTNTMSNLHREILKETGFAREYQLYSWRHTGAVKAVKSGMNVMALQKMFRHHSVAQTEEYLRQMGVFDFIDTIKNYKGI